MTSALVILAAVALKPGLAFVKAEAATARACPKADCAVAGELKGGDALSVAELKGDWARVTVNAKEAWVPAKDLAAGAPERRNATAEAKVLSCPKADCKPVGTLKSGESVVLLEDTGTALRVRMGDHIGYILEKQGLKMAGTATPAYVPPAEPPKYIPPAEPPKYIPPGEPPKYIPADSAPVYIPPAQPAALHQGKPENKNATLLYVRRPTIDVREAPNAGAKVVAPMPGGAKLHVRKTEGTWVQVATAEGATAPALGWAPRGDLRGVPPLIYKLKTDDLKFRPCDKVADKKCAEQPVKGLKKGDALVAIDESEDKKMLLLLLPGQKEGFGWVAAALLEPGT